MSYKKHFLTDVIFRTDFVSAEESLNLDVVPAVKEACARSFPILERRDAEMQNISITANGEEEIKTVVKNEKQVEWHFWGKDREKELVIAPNCMFINSKSYDSFENLKSQFLEIFHEVQANYPLVKINRIGLRYINQIDLLSEKVSRKSWSSYWGKYISKDLIQSLKFIDNEKALARHINTIEMNYEDYMLRFVYGIFNQDYPAPNKKQVYILDADVSSVGLFTEEELNSAADNFHQKAKDWFERSITQALRTKMEGV